jgi:hypothetical protein
LRNEELHVFYSSSDTVWVIKCSISLVKHVTGVGMGVERNLDGETEGRLGHKGWIIELEQTT